MTLSMILTSAYTKVFHHIYNEQQNKKCLNEKIHLCVLVKIDIKKTENIIIHVRRVSHLQNLKGDLTYLLSSKYISADFWSIRLFVSPAISVSSIEGVFSLHC